MAGPGRNKLLVLDGQGVVFRAPIKRFLGAFAEYYEIAYADIEQRWESHVRDLAWRGTVDDDTLWRELAGRDVDAQYARQSLSVSYRPGPATGHIAAWSRKARLWLFSNHRTHWLMPHLVGFGVRQYFERLLVSDNTRFLKPETAAFEHILRFQGARDDMLFVDDQRHNVAAAECLGIRSLLAAPGANWLGHIGEWLDCDDFDSGKLDVNRAGSLCR